MQPLISVITCTHDPREDYLEQVLAALKAQTLDRERWEYIVVDNASASPLEKSLSLSWHPRARCVREDRLGLTHARLRGIRESAGELLVFVDDDNVLDRDYLEVAQRVSREWSILGAWGGQVRPLFEEAPPEWTKPYWSRLVIREFEQDRWSNLPMQHETMPSGAGLCVRRSVALFYAGLHERGRRQIILDRAGASTVSGGDTDLASCAIDLGLGLGLFAALKLGHLIPPSRLEEDYLVRLVEGLAYSELILRSFREEVALSPRRGWTSRAADLLRMARMNRRQRRFHSAVREGRSKARLELTALHAGRQNVPDVREKLTFKSS